MPSPKPSPNCKTPCQFETLLTQYALTVSDLTLAQTQTAYSKTQIESKMDQVHLARTRIIKYVKEIK